MTKREDQRIAKLVKKNTAKIANPKIDRSVQYDDTLKRKPDETDANVMLRTCSVSNPGS